MKRIILLELCLLFLATTFQGDNPPPGWYIQPIPVNKNIVDIYFTDTLHGWAVTDWNPAYDTGYVLKTTNGGINWLINYATYASFSAIQFVDTNIGYASGGRGGGLLYKTTNSGNNWNLILNTGLVFTDLYFINKDTGWVCDNDGLFGVGLLKTTNGGINWIQQLTPAYSPQKLFFLNQDTGWVMTAGGGIYRSNNSGNNWIAQYNFGYPNLRSIFFTSSDTGWITKQNNNDGGFFKTTNGGLNWIAQTDPYPLGGGSGLNTIFMINSTYGYVSTAYSKIIKTIDGTNWHGQNGPNGIYGRGLFFQDSLRGWSTHYNTTYDIATTIDGGGPLLQITNNNEQISKDYKLYQNFPNPFNSSTNFKIRTSKSTNIKVVVYDIQGREVKTLINKVLNTGTYDYKFDGSKLTSGVYFYSLFADGKRIETKRMMLIM